MYRQFFYRLLILLMWIFLISNRSLRHKKIPFHQPGGYGIFHVFLRFLHLFSDFFHNLIAQFLIFFQEIFCVIKAHAELRIRIA